MNYKRIGRVLVCLALVACLIAQMVPARANAIGLSGTVATGTAIAAGLVALGIGVGATETTFNNLVDSLTAVAGSDRVPVWISETADGFVTYLQESFLGSLLAHCFDTGVLVSGLSLPSDCPDAVLANISECSSHKYAFVFYSGNTYWSSYNDSAPFKIISANGGYGVTIDSSTTFNIFKNGSYSGFGWAAFGAGAEHAQFFGTAVGDPISTDEDLTLGSVGATMSSPNYDPWRTAAIPVVPPVVGGGTADEEDVLPVTFPGLDTPSITGQTQAGAQSGVTPGTVVEDILSGGEVVPETGTGTIADVIAAIKAIPASLADFFADVVAAVQAIPAAFASWLDKILEWLAKIWEAIKAIPGLIADAIANVLSLAFAVSDTFIATKVDALTAKYPYLETFIGLGSSLKAFFLNLGSKPPIIYIDLGAATGSYFFGGRQAFIDLTWYSDYKPTMDAILGAFIWLWLAWRVFHALPGIINGISGTVGERVSYSGTQNINLPPLPPQNELPPGHNRRM